MTDEIQDEAKPFVVEASAQSLRLAQLHAAYPAAKAAADAANEQLKAITDAIKLELTQAAPEEQRIELRGNGGPSLRLTWSTSQRFDSRRLKKEHPHVWSMFVKESGSWSLRAVGGAE